MRPETQNIDDVRRQLGLLADLPGLGDERRDAGGSRIRVRRRASWGLGPCHQSRRHEH